MVLGLLDKKNLLNVFAGRRLPRPPRMICPRARATRLLKCEAPAYERPDIPTTRPRVGQTTRPT